MKNIFTALLGTLLFVAPHYGNAAGAGTSTKPANARPVTTGETLEQQLTRQEGFSATAYPDRDHYSIGYGMFLKNPEAPHRLRTMGLDYSLIIKKQQRVSESQARKIFYEDIVTARSGARQTIREYDSQPKKVQDILANMVYNMGLPRFNGFKKLKQHIESKNYVMAAEAMRRSDWYKDTKTHRRAEELRQQMLTVAQSYKSRAMIAAKQSSQRHYQKSVTIEIVPAR